MGTRVVMQERGSKKACGRSPSRTRTSTRRDLGEAGIFAWGKRDVMPFDGRSNETT